jgi:acyl carrier protein
MSSDPLFPRLREILVEHLGVEPDMVTPEAVLRDDLTCDSLDVIELCMACESAFACELPDAEIDELGLEATVADLLALLHRKGGALRDG